MGRPTHKPFDPATAERQRQSRLTREGEARAKARAEASQPQTWGVASASLSLAVNQDLKVVRDGRGRAISALRTDVFETLFARGSLRAPEQAAARRLEMDMGQRVGLFRPDNAYVFVDSQHQVDGPTQRMIEAGARVKQALAAVGARQALLLRALIEPAILHGRVVDWRAVVTRETGETNIHVQAAMVRSACDNLALAYQAIDAPLKRRG